MEQDDIKNELIDSFPPGSRDFLDWQDADGPGPLADAIAGLLKDRGFDQVEQLRAEVNPATFVVLAGEWERSLKLIDTDAARTGDIERRRSQIFARLREFGATTVANIQSIVGPLLDYADPSQLVVLEVDRATLRSAHTYPWAGSVSFNVLTASLSWLVLDTARVSDSGAQVDLTLALTDLAGLTATLTAPDGRTVSLSSVGRGSGTGTFRLYFKAMAGAEVGGLWRLVLGSTIGTGTATAAGLFVEGFGRDAGGFDGLGAAKFFWGVVAEPHLMGPRADLAAAAAAVQRITYATRAGFLILRSDEMTLPLGDFSAIPDDPHTIPSMCVPG